MHPTELGAIGGNAIAFFRKLHLNALGVWFSHAPSDRSQQTYLEGDMVLSFNLVAIGLSDLNHPVDRSTFDEQFHRLIVKLDFGLTLYE